MKDFIVRWELAPMQRGGCDFGLHCEGGAWHYGEGVGAILASEGKYYHRFKRGSTFRNHRVFACFIALGPVPGRVVFGAGSNQNHHILQCRSARGESAIGYSDIERCIKHSVFYSAPTPREGLQLIIPKSSGASKP